MNLFIRLIFSVTWLAGTVFAASETLQFSGESDSGAIYPLTTQVFSGETEGAQFISANTVIEESIIDSVPERENLSDETFSWSYSRGAGALPNICPPGYDSVAGVCAEICQEGYTAALGGCWQDCPEDMTDMGLFCYNWSTLTSQDKEVISQSLVALSCPEGQVQQLGLCFDPCEEGFTGVGRLCIGKFDDSVTSARLTRQVENQHLEAQANRSQGGVILEDEQVPDIRTTVVLSNALCSAKSAVDDALNVFGYAADPLALLDASVNHSVNDALEGVNVDLPIEIGTAWFTPSIANTVLFDFSTKVDCSDDGTLSRASLSVDPSITVQLSTELFDPVLSNLSGVDIGIMNVSIYELIPFRIYGAVGTTVSVPTVVNATLDRTLPALYVDDMQYASQTSFSVSPAIDLWLSAKASLRVTSLFSFIPDLLQLGAELKLTVLSEQLPYTKEAGLRVSDSGGYEIYESETLTSQFKTGHGALESFLKILGVEVDVFGEEGDLSWKGYEQSDTLLTSESVTPVEL